MIDPRKIGRNYETRVVKFFRSKGFQARRVPLSGSLQRDDLKNDVHVYDFKPPLEIECKKTTGSDYIRLFFDNIDKIGLQDRKTFLLLVFSLQRTKNYAVIPFDVSFPFYSVLRAVLLPVKTVKHKEKSVRLKREDLVLVGWNAATGRFNSLAFQSYTGKNYAVTELGWLIDFISEKGRTGELI